MHAIIRAIATSAVVGAVLTTAACGSANPSAGGTQSPSASATPSGGKAQDFQSAVAAFAAIEKAEEPFWAAAKVTPAAKAAFARDWVDPSVPEMRLRQYELAQITQVGLPTVVKSAVTSYQPGAGTVRIFIQQCVAVAGIRTEVAGKQASPARPRHVRYVGMERVGDGPWKAIEETDVVYGC